MFLALLPTLGSVQSSGVIVGVLLPVVGKVLYFLPSAVLASTIIISVASLIDVATAKRLWRQDKGDFLVSLQLEHTGILPSSLLALMCGANPGTLPLPPPNMHRYGQVMACAFLATLVLGVQTGVLVAMGFSLVLFVSKSSKPHIAELGRLFGECSLRPCSVVNLYGGKVEEFLFRSR
jgi:SulP family sulfate permease